MLNYWLYTPQILCALRFFASGSYQLDIGKNNSICLSQSSVSRSLNSVLNSMQESGLFMEKVRFPSTNNELNSVADG